MIKKIAIYLILSFGFLLISGLAFWSVRQKSSLPPDKVLIGILHVTSELDEAVDGFKNGMNKLGWEEGKNTEYDLRFIAGSLERLPAEAESLVAKKVDLIYSLTTPATAAAKSATKDSQIPVVFNPVTSPVSAGLIRTLESSGNNLTGVKVGSFPERKLEFIKEFLPSFKKIVFIYKDGDKSSGPEAEMVSDIAPWFGFDVIIKSIDTPKEVLEVAHAFAAQGYILYSGNDGMVSNQSGELALVAKQYGVPFFPPTKSGVKAGGLGFIGVNYYETGNIAAQLADKILRGAKPQELPIEFPLQMWIAVNIFTAKEIGVEIPVSILSKADWKFE